MYNYLAYVVHGSDQLLEWICMYLNLWNVGVPWQDVIEGPDSSGPLGRIESLPQHRAERNPIPTSAHARTVREHWSEKQWSMKQRYIVIIFLYIDEQFKIDILKWICQSHLHALSNLPRQQISRRQMREDHGQHFVRKKLDRADFFFGLD